jgi:hypothetical protein
LHAMQALSQLSYGPIFRRVNIPQKNRLASVLDEKKHIFTESRLISAVFLGVSGS